MGEVLSIVIGAGPDSAVRHCLDGGWSREAHLLANLQESNSGLATLAQPYERPGLDARPEKAGARDILHGQAMSWEEMDALEEAKTKAVATGKKSATRKTVW